MQTLLLLRQSASDEGVIRYLDLSGPLYEAGTVLDVLHPAAEHVIAVSLTSDGKEYLWKFTHDREVEPAKARKLASASRTAIPDVLLAAQDRFSYLSAERQGPRVASPLPSGSAAPTKTLDSHGENTAAFLARAADGFKIDGWKSLASQAGAAAMQLDSQALKEDLSNTQGRIDLFVSALLSWIVPGFSVSAEVFERADAAVIQYIRDLAGTKMSTRATHVGFGLSYTLPIIVAPLALGPGSLTLIENPEAHLHPYSQSRIGVCLALFAATGRQLFVETHSDHVLNGVRLAVAHGLVSPDDVLVNFFEIGQDRTTARVRQLEIGPRGDLSSWPGGFFDQIENDLAKL